MEFQKVQEAISQLKQQGVTVQEVLCTDTSQTKSLEKTLSIEFAPPIREFYSHYEYLQVGPYEFEWTRNLPNLVERLRRQPDIPWNYLPILSDGMGGYYYAVCAEANTFRPANFGKVVHRPAGAASSVEIACGEFLEFVLSRITNAKDEF